MEAVKKFIYKAGVCVVLMLLLQTKGMTSGQSHTLTTKIRWGTCSASHPRFYLSLAPCVIVVVVVQHSAPFT